MRKVFGFLTLVALVCLLSTLSVCSATESAGFCDDFYYEITGSGEAAITGYAGSATEVVIPETLDGYTITGIQYFGDAPIESITIPATVTDIQHGIGESLKKVYISDLAAWCEINFSSYHANPLYYADELYVNGSLVTTLDIPGTVTRIKDYAFWGFKGFTRLYIPKSLTDIATMAFMYCDNLEKIQVDSDNPTYCAVDYVLFSKDRTQLLMYPMGHESPLYVVPDTVTTIGDASFRGCKNLEVVRMGDSVTTIGIAAFQECDVLEKLYFGSGIQVIDRYSIYMCPNFEAIEVKDLTAWCGVEYLTDDQPFCDGCALYINGEQVTDLAIPEGVTRVGRMAFAKFKGIQRILLPKSLTTIDSLAFYGYETQPEIWYMGDANDRSNMQIDSTNNGLLNATWHMDACSLGVEHDYDNACDTNCNTCFETRTVSHSYQTAWSSDSTNHWHACSICGDKKDLADHTPGVEATETTAQTCTACNWVITPKLNHTHNFAADWTTDAGNHWHTCSGCAETDGYTPHTWENANCTVCGAEDPTATLPTEPASPTEPVSPTEPSGESANDGEENNEKHPLWIWILIACIVLVAIITVVLFRKKRS